MLTVEYSPKGTAVSDFELDAVLSGVIELSTTDDKKYMHFSTSNIFNVIILAVTQNKIDWQRIRFFFDCQDISFDCNARLTTWPEGFLFDTASHYEKILKERFARRRRRNNQG